MKNISSKSSQQRSELNALAPLRIGGLAQSLLEHKNNPKEVERIARELLALEPDILALLVNEAEKTPALETASLPRA